MINSIGQIPAEAAKRYGDWTALIVPDRELTFNELDALTNRCATGHSPSTRSIVGMLRASRFARQHTGAARDGADVPHLRATCQKTTYRW
jgi:hypothetical protein